LTPPAFGPDLVASTFVLLTVLLAFSINWRPHSCSLVHGMIHAQLLAEFATRYSPPGFVIEDVLESTASTVRESLMALLSRVSPACLEQLDYEAHQKARVLFRADDPEMRARLFVVSQEIMVAVQEARLTAASTIHPRQSQPPYQHPAISGISIDSEGLVPLSAFAIQGDGLEIDGHVFFMMSPIQANNANFWTLAAIQRLGLGDAVRVRLDPLLHGPAERIGGRFYSMIVYGQQLDWDRIADLRKPEHGRWQPGSLSTRSQFTDYVWDPRGSEVHFVCEEVPLAYDIRERGSRYFHAVFDKQSGRLTHVDGAIRLYSDAEHGVRVTQHVRHASKIGKRVKVFRAERPIASEALSELCPAFFVWNYDVARYFGTDIPPSI
jgi:hypothetical protein